MEKLSGIVSLHELVKSILPAQCLCRSVFVTSQYAIKRDGWTELMFWHGIKATSFLHCVMRKFRYLQKQGYFPWNFGIFILKSSLRNFRYSIQSSQCAIILACQRRTLLAR